MNRRYDLSRLTLFSNDKCGQKTHATHSAPVHGDPATSQNGATLQFFALDGGRSVQHTAPLIKATTGSESSGDDFAMHRRVGLPLLLPRARVGLRLQPVAAATSPNQSYYPDQLTGVLRCSLGFERRISLPSDGPCWSSSEATPRTKQVCVQGGRFSAHVPQSSAVVSLKPVFRQSCISWCKSCHGTTNSSHRTVCCRKSPRTTLAKGFFTTGQAFKGIFCMDQTGFACAGLRQNSRSSRFLSSLLFPPCSACWRPRSGEPASPGWPQCFLMNSVGSQT